MTIKRRLLRHHRGEILATRVDDYLRLGTPTVSAATWDAVLGIALRPGRDRRRAFSASGLDRCMRQQTFEMLGFPRDEVPDARLSNIFYDGNWRHLRWQALFLEMGIIPRGRVEDGKVILDESCDHLLEVGVQLPGHMVRGTLDAIAVLNDELWLLDIKGANPRTFSDVKAGNGPYRGYRLQLHAYMRATGVAQALLWYEDKASQDYQEVRLSLDDAADAALFDARTAALRHYWERQELPPALPMAPLNPGCARCPYQIDCTSASWTQDHLEEVIL